MMKIIFSTMMTILYFGCTNSKIGNEVYVDDSGWYFSKAKFSKIELFKDSLIELLDSNHREIQDSVLREIYKTAPASFKEQYGENKIDSIIKSKVESKYDENYFIFINDSILIYNIEYQFGEGPWGGPPTADIWRYFYNLNREITKPDSIKNDGYIQ